VVAGAFVAAGWIVAGWQSRRAAAILRAGRLRDTHRALYAEIGAWLAANDPDRMARDQAAMVGRMRTDVEFVPFIPHDGIGEVYRAVLTDLTVLPRSTVDFVVAFYAHMASLAALAVDMRSRRYAILSPERRIALYEDYIATRVAAVRIGLQTLRLIEIYSARGEKAARIEHARIGVAAVSSRPDADRDGFPAGTA
jgi:hypothetical protein